MALTDYVTLGNSGLRVSPFCLGAMTFGEDWGWGSSVAESEAIIGRFLERGGNFIDTANVYTKGHSEKIIGDYIGRDRAQRDRVVIATKFFGNLYPGDPERRRRRPQVDRRRRASSRCAACRPTTSISTGCTAGIATRRSRRRCARSTIWCVRARSATSASPTRRRGRWRRRRRSRAFRGWAPLVALQIEYSLLERTVEGELIPMALELGLGVTPWSPLKSGVLSGKYTRENAATVKADRGERVHAEPRREGLRDHRRADRDRRRSTRRSPASVALAWVQGRPGVASTIIGARRMDQLEQNLAALDVTLHRGSDRAARRAVEADARVSRCSS